MRIESTIDFSTLAREYGTLIPAKVLNEVGIKYRGFRRTAMYQGLSLADLSPQPPLKPETIKRKSGFRKKGGRAEFARVSKKLSSRQHASLRRASLKLSQEEFVRRLGRLQSRQAGFVAMHPETPLVDSGNMAESVNVNA
ncbi:MAG TPA: hypothetical protein VJ044_18710, partial [Candidatus Hodarchaeales archaeon]|nr:hypothetical protein [Candidatus Hodarchaeales archaeon]